MIVCNKIKRQTLFDIAADGFRCCKTSLDWLICTQCKQIIEPRCEKTGLPFVVSERTPHKLGCTATEDT